MAIITDRFSRDVLAARRVLVLTTLVHLPMDPSGRLVGAKVSDCTRRPDPEKPVPIQWGCVKDVAVETKLAF